MIVPSVDEKGDMMLKPARVSSEGRDNSDEDRLWIWRVPRDERPSSS